MYLNVSKVFEKISYKFYKINYMLIKFSVFIKLTKGIELLYRVL